MFGIVGYVRKRKAGRVDRRTPVSVLVRPGPLRDETLGNIEEIHLAKSVTVE